jgi:ribose transport system ATP-binding protein
VGATPRLVVESVAGAGVLRDASLNVAPGEIVGLAGTEGSGKRVLGEIIAGVVRPTSGRVLVNGRQVTGTIGDHVAAGIAYVPPDRAEKGLITSASIVDNVQLASLHDRFATKRVGLWAVGRAREVAERYVDELGIVAESIDAPVSSLSGGNAQKVLTAKWLLRQPDVLVLDEPTQGVDIGSKADIHRLIDQAAADGTATVVCTSDSAELERLCSRVIVLQRGVVIGELLGPEITSERIEEIQLIPVGSGPAPQQGASS